MKVYQKFLVRNGNVCQLQYIQYISQNDHHHASSITYDVFGFVIGYIKWLDQRSLSMTGQD